eukprot:2741233-Pleurochrysis_carterae.AAC.1
MGSRNQSQCHQRYDQVTQLPQLPAQSDFEKQLAAARPKQLVVVDFFATWCGPCKQIAPEFEAMSAQFAHAKFLKVRTCVWPKRR